MNTGFQGCLMGLGAYGVQIRLVSACLVWGVLQV
jgi:hypothetical protein